MLSFEFLKMYPVYTGQAQGRRENIKRGAKIGPGGSLLIFWVNPHLHLKDVFSFVFSIKLSCNTGPFVASNFCCHETAPRKLKMILSPDSIILILG